MSTTHEELKQNSNVLQGLVELIAKDTATLAEYLETTPDTEATQQVVVAQFQERMVETLKRLDITVSRLKYHAQVAVGVAPKA